MTATSPTALAGPGGSLSHRGYDEDNDSMRPNAVTDPQGNQKTYQYDGAGNLTTISANTGQGAEELIKLDYYDEGKRDGLLKSSTDGANHRTHYEYDDQGNLTREIPPGSGGSDPEQGTTEYSYDSLSRIDAVEDGNDVRRTLAYDSLDRTTRTSYPDDTYTRSVYDGAGNTVERADGEAGGGLLGQDDEDVDRYAYDARNLTTQEDLRDGALGDDRVNDYTYDAAGNLLTLRDPSGTTAYGYDARNLVESLTEPERGPNDPRQPFDFDYQEDGQLLRIEFPNGVVQQNGYQKDRLTSIEAGPASDPNQFVDLAYSYDDPDTAEDKQTDLRYKVEDDAQDITTRYQYDNLNRLKQAENSGSSSDRWFYDYNKATNLIRSEREEGDPATRYVYNNSSELRCVYRGAEQDGCPADGTDYDYDQNGNLKTVEGGNSYTYNNRNQTTQATPAGGEAIELGYAGVDQQQRLKRGGTEYTDTVLGLGRERNMLLGQGLLEGSTFYTRDDSGTPLGQRTPQGDFYYLADSIGSVIGLTDQNGDSAGRYRYDPYGQVVENSEAVPNAIRFAGEYYDAQTKLYKIGVRYYDPSVGRWTQKDPLNLFQDPRQANRYAYAGADPVNRTDPSGRDISEGITEAYYDVKNAVTATYRSGAIGRCGVIGVPFSAIGAWASSYRGAAIGGVVGCVFRVVRRTP